MVFHRHFGGIFHLRWRAADGFCISTGRHRAGHAHFALAAHIGTGNRGIGFIQNADGAGGEQKILHPRLRGMRVELAVILQHRWNNARRAIGGRSHHAAAGGVFLVYRHGIHHRP